MKRRRKVLLILALSLILMAILFAVVIEKALNSVLPPEMVKELLDDEGLNKEISSIINDESIIKDVQSVVYNRDLRETSDTTKNIVSSDLIKNSQQKNSTAKVSDSAKNFNKHTTEKDSTAGVSETHKIPTSVLKKEQKYSTNSQQKLSVSTSDQLEAAKIVLSVMSMGEIKELISLYKEGKKSEAIQKGVSILKQRLSPEQKKRLKELYFRYK
ncbi:hypothetical protein Calow_1966 [Caldicellulosiruptor owensensis OL]|uniref:Uncharacterized protein n=1 Tax=Caldicellulosiruptor owensensis (strain ATCC 700167 / DSM 13100 / OL) TaxID=632518 RepID=E4Q5T1_CALOW|nr:hypothetical protein [Caldicellulosiruptor owensensis]ADQ05490.1 hypothetical protein Calow_1966 [Caldicellulosiruptor owensensis OL]